MLARGVHFLFTVYELGLVVYVVSGWILHPAASRFRQMAGRGYEPLLARIRSFVPGIRVGLSVIDLSPVVLFLGIAVVKGLVVSLLVPPF